MTDGVLELPGGTPIPIGDAEGLVTRSVPVRSDEIPWLELVWQACGLEFRMSGWARLLDDEAVRIAASTVKVC